MNSKAMVTAMMAAWVGLGLATTLRAADEGANHAVQPQPRIESWWFARHAEKIEQMEKSPDIELLMIGDSITQNLESEKHGLKVWEEYYAPRKAINLGFGGDRTQHILWRMTHLPKLEKSPRAAVLLAGTNNMGWGTDTPEQTAEGIRAIVVKLKELYPDMNVLVLGILPRRHNPDHAHRSRIVACNALLPGMLKDIDGVTFVDIGPAFLDENGVLPPEVMPDGTHPSEQGHRVWAEAMESVLKQVLGEASE